MKKAIQLVFAAITAALLCSCGTTQAQAQREVRGGPMTPAEHARYMQRQEQLHAQYVREMQEMNNRARQEAEQLRINQERREYAEYLRWQQGQAQPPQDMSGMSRYQRSLQRPNNNAGGGNYNQPQGPVGYGNPQGGRYSNNPNDQSNLGGGYPAAVYQRAPLTYENTYKGKLPDYRSSGYGERLPSYGTSGYPGSNGGGNVYRPAPPRRQGNGTR